MGWGYGPLGQGLLLITKWRLLANKEINLISQLLSQPFSFFFYSLSSLFLLSQARVTEIIRKLYKNKLYKSTIAIK